MPSFPRDLRCRHSGETFDVVIPANAGIQVRYLWIPDQVRDDSHLTAVWTTL